MADIDLTIDYPSRIARMLLNDEIDMGLVPVAVIPQMREYHINGDYCIGSDGPVASVCLFSESPIGDLERILLDYQSRTSVQLTKVLLKEYWKISPELVGAGKDFRSEIRGRTGGLIIGDRALEQRRISPYIYDLGAAWKDLTGLPFVYAAWISNKPLEKEFVRKFNEANRFGLEQIDRVVEENPYSVFSLRDYFTLHLDYHLDDKKRKGLERFLAEIRLVLPQF
jgi:chorismate dehydratase